MPRNETIQRQKNCSAVQVNDKKHRPMNYCQFIVACAGTALLVGCAHKICLKTVDANTHASLAGVCVQWLQARHQMFQTLKQEGPTNLPSSGPDGIINVAGLHKWWTSEFVFTCSGYSNVYATYEGRRLVSSEEMHHFPSGQLQDQFMLSGDLKIAEKSNGCFLIEMQK